MTETITDTMTLTGQAPFLIAHRGYSGRYPENTLIAYQAAYDCGARLVEIDLQLTADLIPFLHHDLSIKRIADVDEVICNINSTQLETHAASYPQRFGDEFSNNTFTRFKIFCEWLKIHSDVTAFVEIKQESIDHFDLATVMVSTFKPILDTNTQSQCIIISFNHKVIEYTQKKSPMKTGWVLSAWNDNSFKKLKTLQPDFVFCDVEKLPEKNKDIWRGNWEWAVYNLDDVTSATVMANRNISFLETNEIHTLMNIKQLLG
jgi:glycerophosphoryl diester phosphodiesterase